MVSFDLIVEPSDKVKKDVAEFNSLYEDCVTAIRKTNPKRVIFIAPPKLSQPEDLQYLKLPSQDNGYLIPLRGRHARSAHLYEHHGNRKYCDNLDESAEGFFWEKLYQTDSEQGSDAYYRKHHQVQGERTPGDVVPGKDLERNFQQVDNQEEPGIYADVFHLLLTHREQIDRHYWSGSIANHCGETAEQTEDCRIPPFMHPSVFLSEHLAPNHYRHRQGERPTHQLAESLCRDEFVNKKCHEKAENSLR